MQRLIRAIYPAQCVACEVATSGDVALCGVCWRDTQFINGTIYDACGTALPGDFGDYDAKCDDCLRIARPWEEGRSMLAYTGVGRKLVLSLKHGDRTDLAQPVARWMVRKAEPLIQPDSVLVPVPLHWVRLLHRRHNQAAILANIMGKRMQATVCLDALIRSRATKPLEGHSRDARFRALTDVVQFNPKRQQLISGRLVILIDDVMTSVATLAACADVCLAAGVIRVDVVTLARVIKDA
jgi:predicted amidophosphoribosyltransferase